MLLRDADLHNVQQQMRLDANERKLHIMREDRFRNVKFLRNFLNLLGPAVESMEMKLQEGGDEDSLPFHPMLTTTMDGGGDLAQLAPLSSQNSFYTNTFALQQNDSVPAHGSSSSASMY